MMKTHDEQAIRDVISTWLAASAAGDGDTVLSLMTDDVAFLTPGRAPMRKSDFAAAQSGLADVQFEATSDIQEIEVRSDIAYCWSRLTVVVTPRAGGTPVRRAGDVLSIFRKQPDGAWKLHRDANLLTTVAQ
jgi:uncharacterized protein (TIGR02246 family)